MRRAVILGGTGAIGVATAALLASDGWDVTVTGRDAARMPADLLDAGVRFAAADRDDPADLATVYDDGADLLVDCVCFTGDHARALLPFVRHATSTVLLSSRAVYVDDVGRHANSAQWPRFAAPVREDQPTLPPGDGPYDTPGGYGSNKVAAERVLLDSGLPVTVVRPSVVHGPGARNPREWWAVRRILDRRPAVLLSGRGAGSPHPTSAAAVADVVRVAADCPGARVLNVADSDTPTARQIVRTIAESMGHRWREVLLDDDAPPGLGAHPWDVRPAFLLDTTAARALGHRPVGSYAQTVEPTLRWLTTRPTLDERRFAGRFDYAAEDRYLAG